MPSSGLPSVPDMRPRVFSSLPSPASPRFLRPGVLRPPSPSGLDLTVPPQDNNAPT
jgi:hypothetical protein